MNIDIDHIQIADDPTYDDRMIEMPFGKYRDTPLDQIPRGYLRWLLSDCELSPDLKADIQAVVAGQPLPKSMDERVAEFMDAKYGQYEPATC